MAQDTDISRDQNITFGQVAPFVKGSNVSREGSIAAANKFNTFTNFIGLGADIAEDINKDAALTSTGEDVLGVIDDYKKSSPTLMRDNILDAQNTIAEKNKKRLEIQEGLGYDITNETPTLLLDGIDKSNQSFLIDIEKDINFITKAKSQRRMTDVEAETRINDIYRKKLSQYPYLAPEILQHGARVKDLYGFNSLLSRDNALLKSIESNTDDTNKAYAAREKVLLTELGTRNILKEAAMVPTGPDGESVFNHRKAEMLIDSNRAQQTLDEERKRAQDIDGFNAKNVIDNMPYKAITSNLYYNVGLFQDRLKQVIAQGFAGPDGILNTEDDTLDNNTRAMIANNIESLKIQTRMDFNQTYQPYRVGGAANTRFEVPYKDSLDAIDAITANLKGAVTKSDLSSIASNASTIISAINAQAVFDQFGSNPAIGKAMKAYLPDPEMMKWLKTYYMGMEDQVASALGMKNLNLMITNGVQMTSLGIDEMKESMSVTALNKTILPGTTNKVDELLLYTIENNKTAPLDNPILTKYITHINDTKLDNNERYNSALEFINILANGTLTKGRVEALKEGTIKIVDSVWDSTTKGLMKYNELQIEDNIENKITQDSTTNLLSSTNPTLNNGYLKTINNLYKVNRIFKGEKLAKQELTNLLDSLEAPVETKAETTFVGASLKNNLGNLKKADLSGFQEFKTRDEGIIAANNLVTRIATGKHANHIGKNINTVKGIIDIWRPELDQRGLGDILQKDYIKLVSDALGVEPTAEVDFSNKENMATFLESLFRVEGNPASKTEILSVLNR